MALAWGTSWGTSWGQSWLLYEPPATGSVIPGASLYFEISGQPAAIYADAELQSALPNPVYADSGGLFPAIYLRSDTVYTVTGANGWDFTETYPPQPPAGPFTIEVGEFPDFGDPNARGYNGPGGWGSVISSGGDYPLRQASFRPDTTEVFLYLYTPDGSVAQDLFDTVTFSNGVGSFNSADASTFTDVGSYALWIWTGATTDLSMWPLGSTRTVTFT
jgi:hypothetical protein